MSDHTPSRSRVRFGIRWLLLVVAVFAGLFTWFARESQRVSHQQRLVSELSSLNISVRMQEPTGLALLTSRFGSHSWVQTRMDDAWFGRPRVLVAWKMTDDDVHAIIQHIRQLSHVREMHVERSPLSDAGISTLKQELPGIAVLTRNDLRNAPPQLMTHSGAAALDLLGVLVCVGAAVALVLAWPLVSARLRRAA